MDNFEWLWHWIRTRENVRVLKECGAIGPWCNDPIITNNHFCNVRREDDRGTRDIRKVVQNSGIGTLELPWVYTLARMFNHAGTTALALRAWLEGADWPTAVKWHRDRGNKIFNTAYVVSTCGESMDKVDYVGRIVGQVRQLSVPRDSLEAACEVLMSVNGLGSFLAGQVIADLKNDRFLAGAEDWFTWATMGPGSKKGMGTPVSSRPGEGRRTSSRRTRQSLPGRPHGRTRSA